MSEALPAAEKTLTDVIEEIGDCILANPTESLDVGSWYAGQKWLPVLGKARAEIARLESELAAAEDVKNELILRAITASDILESPDYANRMNVIKDAKRALWQAQTDAEVTLIPNRNTGKVAELTTLREQLAAAVAERGRLEGELAAANYWRERWCKDSEAWAKRANEHWLKLQEQAARLKLAGELVEAVREEIAARQHDNLTQKGFERHGEAVRARDAALARIGDTNGN